VFDAFDLAGHHAPNPESPHRTEPALLGHRDFDRVPRQGKWYAEHRCGRTASDRRTVWDDQAGGAAAEIMRHRHRRRQVDIADQPDELVRAQLVPVRRTRGNGPGPAEDVAAKPWIDGTP
jgi:hypothetical protein